MSRPDAWPASTATPSAWAYWATQDFIVPKTGFYRVLREWAARHLQPADGVLRILEPGIGPAGAYRELLGQSSAWAVSEQVHLVGADLSPDMIGLATQNLKALSRECAPRQRLTYELYDGVNCTDFRQPFYERVRQAGGVDLVLSSQFDHYFPNSATSPLGRRLAQEGLSVPDKRSFRALCQTLLRPGGAHVIMDDFEDPDAGRHEAQLLAWDTHVAAQLTDPGVVEAIARVSPETADSIRRRYGGGKTAARLLEYVRRVREHRRWACREEIEPLAATLEDLRTLYGPGSCRHIRHERQETHGNFFMVWAWRG